MEEYVQAAVSRKLQQITFLEHLECGINYDHRTWLTRELFDQYFSQGRRLQQQYRNRIVIRLGVEVGYNPDSLPEILKMLASFPFEHIGLSYHFLAHNGQHLNMVSRRQDNLASLAAAGTDKVIDAYFNGLIRACSELSCDKLCHLDAVLRHLPDLDFTTHHRHLIEQLLQTMQRHNIALEVNTSGIALRSSPYPAADIIRRAAELDLDLVAGSDAHRPEHVGRGFDQLTAMSCGG
jgi:histidinol-phosphatase (PHP family)